MRIALFWVITGQVVVTPYRRFGTTYRPHLQGSNSSFGTEIDHSMSDFDLGFVRTCQLA